jgi:hypothetical protein
MNLHYEIFSIIEQIVELSDIEKDEIFEFLEHNEWGIAFETLCAILVEEDIGTTPLVFKQIEKVGKHMELDSFTWEGVRCSKL